MALLETRNHKQFNKNWGKQFTKNLLDGGAESQFH